MKIFHIQAFSLVDGRRAEFQSFVKEAGPVLAEHFPEGVRHAGVYVNTIGGDHEVEIWTEFPSLAHIETFQETIQAQYKTNGELAKVMGAMQTFRNPNLPFKTRLVTQLEEVTYAQPMAKQ